MTTYDVAVAGGGLAGSAFAITLARAGQEVVLVERTRNATPKVCGDFLSAEAIGLLDNLGVNVHAHGAARVTDFRFVCGTASAEAPLAFEGAGLTRLKLDELLLQTAASAGVRIERGRTVRGMHVEDRHVEMTHDDGVVRARCAALATGKHNLRGMSRPVEGPVACKMTFRATAEARASLAGIVQLAAYGGGYLGACLMEDDAMTLCWLPGAAALTTHGGDWEAQLAHIAERIPAVAELLSGAEPLFERAATVSAIPYGYRRHEPIASNVYALGDQLAVIPSLTGDGTSIALATGMSAARAVLAGVPASDWQPGLCRALGPQFRVAGALDQLFASAPLRHIGVRAARLLPGVVTRLSAMTRLGPALAGSGN